MLFLLFVGLSSALFDQLNRQAMSALEKSSSTTTVPSFEVFVEPFVDVLMAASNNGLFCFKYAGYNYGLFQQLSGQELNALWAALPYYSDIKSAVDAEISAFPSHWNKAYPDVPITFDEEAGVYLVCWK